MIKNAICFIIVLLVVAIGTAAFADTRQDIYSKLQCCKCGKQFAPCSCVHAKEIKAYIDALLEMDLNENQILLKIAKKYSLDTIIDRGSRKAVEKKLLAEAGESRPQIFIKPLSYNLGKVKKSRGKLELKVKLRNKGNEVLKITNLKTTCACTTVKLIKTEYTSQFFGTKGVELGWEVDIEPKEEGEIIIVTDLNHAHVHLGHMVRTVEIRSNDPIYPLLNVEFEAEIVE